MNFFYKNTPLEIYSHNARVQYDINRDININLLRRDFNRLISKLSIKHNSTEYWLMKISERNTLTHDLFLDFCRIHLVDLLKDKYSNIDIHTNNCALYSYYEDQITMSKIDRMLFFFKKFFEMNRPYFQLLKFVLKGLFFHVRFSRKKFTRNLDDHVVIQTWASDNNFIKNNFIDGYYSDLAQYLRINGKKVVTWIAFYNINKQKKAVDFIRSNQSDYLIMEDYLKPIDYIRPIVIFFKKRFFNFSEIKLNEKNLSNVFHYYQKIETLNYSFLFLSLFRRLMLLSCKNITFIQHFENMISEKSLILGVKKYLPESIIIGYFHTSKPKNLLCLDYASKKEFDIAPKPNVVIFNSDFYKAYFENKYNNFSAYSGYAFKQAYLLNYKLRPIALNKKILVLFSGVASDIETMFCLLNKTSFSGEFLFRMHPMNHFDINKYYSKKNYKIYNCDDKNLGAVFGETYKVISTYSASLLESSICGLHVGLVYNKERLLLNPFDDTPVTNYSLISSVDDMRIFLEIDVCQRYTDNIFNVDKSLYSSFLQRAI